MVLIDTHHSLTATQKVMELAWDMLQDTIRTYRWPRPLQEEAAAYLQVLFVPTTKNTPLANHIAITEAGGRLNKAEAACFQRKNKHVGRAVRERAAAATFVMRNQLRGIDLPLCHEIWYKDFYGRTERACRRNNRYAS